MTKSAKDAPSGPNPGKPDASADAADETTFDQDLERLDATVRALEEGRLGLDAALLRFEEGVALARRLRARLDAAQGRVDELLEDGSVRELDPDV